MAHSDAKGKRTFIDVWDRHADGTIYWRYRNPINVPISDRDYIEELKTKLSQAEGKLSILQRQYQNIIETQSRTKPAGRKPNPEKLDDQAKKIKELIDEGLAIDCRTDEIDPMTKGMLMMWGVFSEMERDIISQRVKSGIENVKSNGKKIGRPVVDATNLPEKFLKHYPMYKNGSINVTDLANMLKCSRTTVYKYINLIS